jgi:hypothetical protein
MCIGGCTPNSLLSRALSLSLSVGQTLYGWAYQRKLRLLREGIVRNDTIWDRLVFDSIRLRLGGRVRGPCLRPCGEPPMTSRRPPASDMFTWVRTCVCTCVRACGRVHVDVCARVRVYVRVGRP